MCGIGSIFRATFFVTNRTPHKGRFAGDNPILSALFVPDLSYFPDKF